MRLEDFMRRSEKKGQDQAGKYSFIEHYHCSVTSTIMFNTQKF